MASSGVIEILDCQTARTTWILGKGTWLRFRRYGSLSLGSTLSILRPADHANAPDGYLDQTLVSAVFQGFQMASRGNLSKQNAQRDPTLSAWLQWLSYREICIQKALLSPKMRGVYLNLSKSSSKLIRRCIKDWSVYATRDRRSTTLLPQRSGGVLAGVARSCADESFARCGVSRRRLRMQSMEHTCCIAWGRRDVEECRSSRRAGGLETPRKTGWTYRNRL